MQAIILAAGAGKRLKEITQNKPKCMVEVAHTTLIGRLLNQLDKMGISRIIIVTGYKEQFLKEYVTGLQLDTRVFFVNNPDYADTNNIYSLYLARAYMCEDHTLLFESDLIMEDSVISGLIEDKRETLAVVDEYQTWMDGGCVTLSEDDKILAFVPGNRLTAEEKYYKTVNIYKFCRSFSEKYYIPFLETFIQVFGKNDYYEKVLGMLCSYDSSLIQARVIKGRKWYEIDNQQDLEAAKSLFQNLE